MTENIILLFFLGYNAWKDLKTRKISLISIMICFAAIVISDLISGQIRVMSFLTGMIPGIATGILSILSGGQIGFGDALIITITGGVEGWQEMIWVLFWAWTGAAVYAGVLLFRKKTRRIPFVPFLFLGYTGELLINIWIN